MIFGEKEEQLIALDVETDRQLGRAQDLPAEWRAILKKEMATEAIKEIPSVQSTTIKLMEEQVRLMEQRIQEQAQGVEAARKSFKEATAENIPYNLEDWKQQLSLLEEKVEQVRVEVAL